MVQKGSWENLVIFLTDPLKLYGALRRKLVDCNETKAVISVKHWKAKLSYFADHNGMLSSPPNFKDKILTLWKNAYCQVHFRTQLVRESWRDKLNYDHVEVDHGLSNEKKP
jgi:hypothetical protein